MTSPFSYYRPLIGAAMIAFALVSNSAKAPAFEAEQSQSFADIASRVKGSVVTVAAAVVDRHALAAKRKKNEEGAGESEEMGPKDDFTPSRPKQKPGEPPRQFTSIGSGFVIDPSGLIVTNNHVIEGGNAIYVILSDGTELKVDKIIGRDVKSDLTLLKVTPKAAKPLPAVAFGDSSRARVGDWVLAIGNPFGLNGTVTAGILSGRGRDINAGPYDDFLQTDAAINRGNSGGPLFNEAGEVIGVNTAIFSPSGGSIGLGFAIPSNTARRIVDQLERYGETRWGWIGVRIQTPSDDLAASYHLPGPSGALIAQITKGGPADVSGLEEGDVILSLAGLPIKHARQLPRLVAQAPIGEDVDAEILRNGERKSVKVRIGRMEEASSPELSSAPQPRSRRQKYGKIGFVPMPEGQRTPLLISADGAEGAVIVEAAQGLEAGDVVTEAAHRPVRNSSELEARLAELRQMGRSDAVLTVRKSSGAVEFASLQLQAAAD